MTILATLYPDLRKAPVLATLRDAHFNGLLGAMKEHKMAPGEVLFREGQPGDTMAVIARGAFRVSVKTADGGQREIGTMGPGDSVGEMVCVDPALRSATVTAILPSVVFLLRRNMLQILREKGPPVVMAILTGVVGQVTDRIRKIHAQIDKRIAAVAPQRSPGRPMARAFPEADALTPQPYRGHVDLGKVSAFSEFSSADQEILKAVSRHLQYPPGAVLCREGDPGSSCFIVVEGEVELHKEIGGETRLLTSLSGCLLGQMALVDPSPRSATLRTRTRVVALELVRDAFQQLLGEHSPCALRFQEMLAITGIRQLREATERLAGLQDAPTRPKRPEIGSLAKHPPKTPDRPAPAPRERRAEGPPKRKGPRPIPTGRRPKNDKEALHMTLSYMQASLQEWGMDMDDLDDIQVVRPDGIMSAAERKFRKGR